jgi:hypothetical protein
MSYADFSLSVEAVFGVGRIVDGARLLGLLFRAAVYLMSDNTYSV